MIKCILRHTPSVSVLLLLLFVAQTRAQDAISTSNELLREQSRYEQALARAESEYGAFDLRLVETLQDLEQVLREQGEFEQALTVQNRVLQLLRSGLGLDHPDTLPVLADIIELQTRLGRWQDVSDSLEHVAHIQASTAGRDSDLALAAMEAQAQWYLTRVAWDTERSEADNLMDARDLYDDILDLAEDRFAEQDPALIPWLYNRAYSLYLLVAMLNSDSGIAGATIDEVIFRDGSGRLDSAGRRGFDSRSVFGPGSRIPIVEEGELVGEAYLRQALGLIDDIMEIAEAHGDAELQAMLTLTHGDFQMVMRRTTARRDYRDAREMLMAAGIARQEIDRVLATPMVIPHQRLFRRFGELADFQEQLLAEARTRGQDESGKYIGVFTAWHEDISAMPRPGTVPDQLAWQPQMNEVELSLRLTSRGQVSSVDVLSAEPDERRSRSVARRGARELHFRPALVEGRPETRRDQYLIYRFAKDD